MSVLFYPLKNIDIFCRNLDIGHVIPNQFELSKIFLEDERTFVTLKYRSIKVIESALSQFWTDKIYCLKGIVSPKQIKL